MNFNPPALFFDPGFQMLCMRVSVAVLFMLAIFLPLVAVVSLLIWKELRAIHDFLKAKEIREVVDATRSKSAQHSASVPSLATVLERAKAATGDAKYMPGQ